MESGNWIEWTLRLPHIVGGSIALIAGAVALYASKGANLHRKSGIIFVYAMLVMTASGAIIAAVTPKRLSVIAGVLTFYLVITALRTIRKRAPGQFQWFDVVAMAIAMITGVYGITLGVGGLGNATGQIDGLPVLAYIVFGAVALIASLLDLRMLLAGSITGEHRIARHLWRMCFAMYMATSAFFLGQAKLFPEPLRNIALLAIPVVIVLAMLIYWLVRVLFTQWSRRANV